MKSQTLKTRTIPIGLNITANSCVGMEVGHSPGIYVTSFEVGHFCGKYDSCMQYIYHASDFKSNRVNTLPTADSWYRKPTHTLPWFVLILIFLQRWQHRARNETKHFVSPHLIGPQLHQHDLASK